MRNRQDYQTMYERSIQDPAGFWGEQAVNFIDWYKPWTEVVTGNFTELNVKWFVNGKLNACFNCLDRHLPHRAHQAALIWESDEPGVSSQLSYAELHEQVCRFANVLKAQNVKKGDRVCIYMPMIPEVVIAMLACARIGAIHSVVFGGFSSTALKNRILDSDCRVVITANEGVRAHKLIPLKKNVDEALQSCPHVDSVIVVKRTENDVPWNDTKDHWYHEVMTTVSKDCPCEEMDASDPLFILYTSGSTGKPKGILHSTGGYLVYVTTTFRYVFDYQEGEIYWCTADVGWVTGHSYLVYGPLANGATSLIFEGVPNYPDPSRYWQIVDKFGVNIFYTSPTALRALRREGDSYVKATDRDSLRILGTVGEPINPDVWHWYNEVVGKNRCQIVDTWWQTETGGILISPLPYVTPPKGGSVAWPFFGIKPAVFDEKGNEAPRNQLGKLVITQPWPGMMQTIYGDQQRFADNYFKEYPGVYFTGDDALLDQDGYYWILGRNDDVLKISGHRIGTCEVENAFLTDHRVAEAAVVAVPHEIKGEAIYAFINLKKDVTPNEELKKELSNQVRAVIGAIATPDYIQWADALPKTRSGKIMRRLLRKIANNETEHLGDTSTLADPGVLESLINSRVSKV